MKNNLEKQIDTLLEDISTLEEKVSSPLEEEVLKEAEPALEIENTNKIQIVCDKPKMSPKRTYDTDAFIKGFKGGF